MKVTKT